MAAFGGIGPPCTAKEEELISCGPAWAAAAAAVALAISDEDDEEAAAPAAIAVDWWLGCEPGRNCG